MDTLEQKPKQIRESNKEASFDSIFDGNESYENTITEARKTLWAPRTSKRLMKNPTNLNGFALEAIDAQTTPAEDPLESLHLTYEGSAAQEGGRLVESFGLFGL